MSSRNARALGERVHASELTRRSQHERWSRVWWLLVGTGLLFFVLALVQAGNL